ncbi:MAG: hypothetical protein EA369_03880 [Bradymonadales bacterium]|nr:MAG: hypothetical protein EA369_03880 [Bradymonadales bacterium]
MPGAVLVHHEKLFLAYEVIAEVKVWSIDHSEYYPEGFKYSLFAVREGSVLVGYDNHKPKSHHRHYLGKETVYSFRGIDKLMSDFWNDLQDVLDALSKEEV